MKKAFFLLLIFGFFNQCLFAQDREKDSLIALVKNSRPDTNKVHALIDLAEYDFSDSLTTFNSLKEAQELCERIGFKKGILKICIVYATYYNQASMPEEAIEKCREGLKIIKENKLSSYPLWLVKLKLTMGNSYIYQANYDKAVKEYLDAIPVAEANNYISNLASLFANTSTAFRNLEQPDMALKYALKGLQYEHKIKDKNRLANMYQNVGNAYYDLVIRDSVLKYYKKELAIRLTLNDRYTLSDTYDNIGILYGDIKQYDKGLEYCMLALRIRQEIKDIPGIAKSYQTVASMYQGEKKYKKAIQMLDTSMIYAKQCNDVLQQEDNYYYLSYNYALEGDYPHAYENNVRYAKIRDSILNSDTRQKVVETEAKYETLKKEKENSELKRKTEVQELQLVNESQKRRTQLILAISLIGLLIIGSVFFYNRYKLKQKAILAQELANEEKKRFRAIIEAEENERSRIARELHDGLGQLLSTARLNVAGLEDAIIPEEKQWLDKSLNIIDEACVEVRNISHNMMPNALIRLGLESAIKELVNSINASKLLQIDYQSNIEGSLGKSLDITVYRIIQEILNNMIKHSGASFINFVIRKESERLLISMKDNGKGFDTDKLKDSKGIGWKNIFSRISMMDGTIELNSELHKGTEVYINLKLRQDEAGS